MAALMSFFSLVGLPPTLGFAAKLYAALAAIGSPAPYAARALALSALAGSIAFSALYGLRYIRIHWASPEGAAAPPIQSGVERLQGVELVLGSENVVLMALLYPVVAEKLMLALTLISLPLLPLIVYASLLVVRRSYGVSTVGAGLG